MTAEDRERVIWDVEKEGFHYAFADYSDYDEIKDEEFHRLRNEYLKAAQALKDYVGIVW